MKFQEKSFVKAMSIFVFYENNVIPAKSWLNKLWEISYLHLTETFSGKIPLPLPPSIVIFMSGISIKCKKHSTIYLFFCEVLYLKYKSNGLTTIHATLLLNTNILYLQMAEDIFCFTYVVHVFKTSHLLRKSQHDILKLHQQLFFTRQY